MGIRRKIILGFISIGTLLFLSGLFSSAELVRFNRSTSHIIQLNRNSIELSKQLLDAAQEQNTALLMSLNDTASYYQEMIREANIDFERLYAQAEAKLHDITEVQNIGKAYNEYQTVVKQGTTTDTLTMAWFSQMYQTSYYALTTSIKEFMIGTQNRILKHTKELENNAYRASMVGIIALAGGVILMLLLYYMINHFFISPVLKIRAGVRRSLAHNMPYDVTIATKDEINALSSDISQLVSQRKKL